MPKRLSNAERIRRDQEVARMRWNQYMERQLAAMDPDEVMAMYTESRRMIGAVR
jgi:hypothetical protein